MARPPFQTGDFVGHKKAAKSFQKTIINAINRSEVRPPSGLVGGTGPGKTDLKELGSVLNLKVRFFIVNKKTTRDELIIFFKSLDYSDIAFIDEAHNLSQELQEPKSQNSVPKI